MFRIRSIYDDSLPVNRESIRQIKDILRSRFSAVPEPEIDSIEEKLRNPFKRRFRSILLAAETLRGKVLGFAMLLHDPEIGFVFLDWIAAGTGRAGSGIGGALYDRVRLESATLKVKGLFFECLPDEKSACPDAALLKDNRARLRFYERYGARPIVNTAYESPVNPGDGCMPYLVYDGLGSDAAPSRSFAKKVIRAILERKYLEYCPPDYVEKVLASLKDDPVRIRPFRYLKPETIHTGLERRAAEQIALIVNERHEIHHVHERGYVESPVRVRSILIELDKSGLFTRIAPRLFPDKHIQAVHDPDFIQYLRKACAEVPEGKSLYPYVFPIRNKTRPPREPSVLAGYYCIDTFTPINRNAFPAARAAVDCALTAAREILDGRRISYALIRPPGHHAERRAFGGFCYFNNCAIAAHYLSSHGKVAILDLDHHHGNGQQDIFYRRSDVLTVSLHGHPEYAYPYFSGFREETGEGEGDGYNLNLPLPEKTGGKDYRRALSAAMERIRDFDPRFLVVALGLDTAKGDPTGTFSLTRSDFEENGRMVGAMGYPLAVIQEGGYRTRTLGINARAFFQGLEAGVRQWKAFRREPKRPLHGVVLRTEPGPADPGRIRRLVDLTGFFSPDEVAVAEELVLERLEKGAASDYFFVIAEHDGRLAGYTCYGPIPCTRSSHDLYWIAVHPEMQGRGMGRMLLLESERRIKAAGGERVYVDTSEREQYAGTRAFYENNGYRLECVLADFYAPGDGKVIYCKTLTQAP
ncbi:MAG: GNAT family N-acetyltransferase [Thermodesulfobacteriota bacterium]